MKKTGTWLIVSSARSWKPKQKNYEDKSPYDHFYSWSESRERGQRSLRGGFVVGRQEGRKFSMDFKKNNTATYRCVRQC